MPRLPRRRSAHPRPPIALGLIVAMTLAAGCSGKFGSPRAVVAMDEAFAAARPELASRLRGSGLGELPLPENDFGRVVGSLIGGFTGAPLSVSIPLSGGAGAAIDTALAERKRTGKPVVLAASPLVAKSIIASGTWSGDPPLLVPEYRDSIAQRPGLWIAITDPVPAYRAAGLAAGAFIAALAKEGGSPSCGVVFAEAPSRPRAALTAFAEAYAEASDGLPLLVRELLEQGHAGAAGAVKAVSPPSTATGTSGQPMPDPQTAVAELLGSDIRLLFVALGASSGAAIRAANRPGLVVGADFAPPEPPSSLAFRILPDDAAIVRSLRAARARIEKGETGGMVQAIPARLVPGPFAGSIRAGRIDFGRFLIDASRFPDREAGK